MCVIHLKQTVSYFLKCISAVLFDLLLNKIVHFSKTLCILVVFKILGYIK